MLLAWASDIARRVDKPKEGEMGVAYYYQEE